jgi:single-strand DNA-binding protein
MLNTTQVTIVGNTGDAPELRYTPTGTPVASFSVAVPQRRYDREAGKWQDTGTTWYRVNAWRDLAEHVAESIGKGARVIVVGALASRDWESNGKTGTTWEITADACGPDLTWATAAIKRTRRDGVPPPDDPWAGDESQ